MSAALRALVGLIALVASGCISVYKTEIRQGNIVSQDMVDKLKPGMTRSQVRFVLGTPLVNDPFHADRWDYIYYYKKNIDAPAEMRRLTVLFNGDALARLEGDIVTARTAPPGIPSSEPIPATDAQAAPSEPRSRALLR